jgi:hypothetical protein
VDRDVRQYEMRSNYISRFVALDMLYLDAIDQSQITLSPTRLPRQTNFMLYSMIDLIRCIILHPYQQYLRSKSIAECTRLG